jgi:hypothetical protein
MAMMASLQRRLKAGTDAEQERRFFAHTLLYLTTSSGQQVELEDWTITSYDVEFGPQVGSGGLYVFRFSHHVRGPFVDENYSGSGRVYIGNWNNTTVALKVLITEDGVTPSATVSQ